MHLQEPCFLFTMDVDSLYTNINIPLGMAAITKWLIKYPSENRPDQEILSLLTRNNFQFNSNC